MPGDGRPTVEVDVLSSAEQDHQLLQAAFYGGLDLVKSLLKKDNLNARDAIGRTPLALACWGGHYEVAAYLLDAGADITGQLRHVSTLKHAKIVDLLLRCGADVNEQYPDGQRPLHHACERENIEVVKVLLKYGADVSAKDFYGKAPLHYSSTRGNQSLTEILLKHHCDINTTDLNLRTPLHSACRYLSVVRTLLEKGADVNPFDTNGCTPLNESSLEGNVLTTLLDYGCGANVLCRRPKCLCNRTVLLCRYLELRGQGDEKVECFEQYFIKAREVNILNDKKIPTDTAQDDSFRATSFRAKCIAELARMKSEFIACTTIDYHSLLSQDLSNMRNQPFLSLTPECCRQKFPIYGDMIYSNFLKIKRVLLLEWCTTLFALTDLPWLPPECVLGVLKFLSDEDLSNAATLCRP